MGRDESSEAFFTHTLAPSDTFFYLFYILTLDFKAQISPFSNFIYVSSRKKITRPVLSKLLNLLSLKKQKQKNNVLLD